MDLKNFKSIKILKNQSNYKIKLLINISFFFFFFKEKTQNFFFFFFFLKRHPIIFFQPMVTWFVM